MTFEDVTEAVGLPTTSTGLWGASWYDADEDGWLELTLNGHHHPPKFFSYSAVQTFTDVTYRFQGEVTIDQDRHNIVYGDYVHDGAVEFYIIHGGQGLEGDKRNELLVYDEKNDVYVDVAEGLGLLDPYGKGRGVVLFDYSGDQVTDLYLVNSHAEGSSPSSSYLGDMQGGFTPDPDSGLGISSRVWGGPSLLDHDNDGDTDVLIPDRGSLVLLGNVGGLFTDVAAQAGLNQTELHTTGTVGDFDNDGWMDIVVGHEVQGPSDRLTLYRNLGDGTFETVPGAGLDAAGQFGEIAWADFDNDGFLDLYVGVEELEGEDDRNLLYRNLGDGTFEEIGVAAGVIGTLGVNDMSAAVADYDRDGRVDILTGVGYGDQPDQRIYLYHNTTDNGNGFVGIELRGPVGNAEAIGARVMLEAGETRQYRQHYIGMGFHSQHSPILHFGVGTHDVLRAEVTWPNGLTRNYENIQANTFVTLTQPTSGGPGIAFVERSDLMVLDQDVYFGVAACDFDGDDFEDMLHGRHQHAHPLILFNDGLGEFQVGVELGPGLDRDRHVGDCVDFDNDGDQDIYYGSGRQRPHELWQNDGTGLHFEDLWLDLEEPYITGNARSTVWFDWNNDGFLDLFMIVGRNATYSKFAENVGGTGVFIDRTEEVGLYAFPLSSNGGCGLSDFDFDGDVDLFLCNPSADGSGGPDNHSMFYRQNADGTFTDVLDDLLGEEVKFWTTSARWGDYDNDADMDLYVTRGYFYRDYGEEDSGDGVNLLQPDKMEFFSRVDFDLDDTQDGFRVNVAGATAVTLDLRDFRCNDPERCFIPPPELEEIYLGEGAVNPTTMPFEMELGDAAMYDRPPMDASGDYYWLETVGGGVRLQYRHRTLEGSEGLHYSTGYILTDGVFSNPLTQNMERSSLRYPDQLYRNNGDGTFTNVTTEMGIDNDQHAVVAGWHDFDNDGDLDLLVINFHYDVPDNRAFILYRNDGPEGFVDVASTAGFAGDLNATLTSSTVADFNVDGYLDFAITWESGPPPRMSGAPKYYLNQGGANRWLEVKLVGTVSNRDAIGSKLWLTTAGGVQFREQMGGFHAFGQDAKTVHFGVADAEAVDLAIQWPAGGTQIVDEIPTNQRITVVETPIFGDAQGDGDLDLLDFASFQSCYTGPCAPACDPPLGPICRISDGDSDGDVDADDFSAFAEAMTGPH